MRYSRAVIEISRIWLPNSTVSRPVLTTPLAVSTDSGMAMSVRLVQP